MKYQPHDYQKRAIKFMIERACAGLFLDPGLGKTSIALAAFKILKSKSLVNRMLVVAPLRPARSVWPSEVDKWDDFTGLRIKVLHGADKQWSYIDESDITVINPEGLSWLFDQAKQQRAWPWEMLVVDESTKFKHTNTKRFKLLKQFLDRFRRRYILTGTPAPNGLLDLFGQIYILDLGNALGRFITHYRLLYFDSVGYGGFTWIPKKGAEERIYAKLAPLVLRMDAADYLELPPLISNRIEVELPPEARKIYDAMENLLITAVENETVTAANIAAAGTKCRQIANGGIYRDDGRGWVHVHDAKIEAVVDLIEQLQGKPALIAYEFLHDLDRLKKAFGPRTPHLGGGVSTKEQTRIEAAWNAGDIPILLAQPQSVAHGLNLQGVGSSVIWYALTFNLEIYDQMVRRVWRQGQRERVVVHHIVAKDTIDEAMMGALRAKDRTQRALLSALRTYAQQRRH